MEVIPHLYGSAGLQAPPPPVAKSSIDDLLEKAYEREASRDLAGAAEIVDRALAAGHCTAPIALLFARLAEDLGREEEALEVVIRAMAGPDARAPRTLSSLQFTAAQLLDRMGRYGEAFAYATCANAPLAASYDPVRMENMIRTCAELFSAEKLPSIARASRPDATPVFILGMPRSGSTLVEQVLASHPQIFGGGELLWVNRLWHALVSRLGGNLSLDAVLARMTVADVDAVAAEYLSGLRGLHPRAARVTDKNLSNFMHLGLISRLFPAARVIHCRRDPLDTGISCYLTDFADVLPFTCSLPALGHFNLQHDRLMAHWKQTLDLPILDVEYEAVVEDLEGQARRMLDFLDLQWDERCLQFHRNPRRVATASKAQVRRPLYRSSIQRWRHYEPWIGPLRQALGL
jgi:hypothetical protein